jgi:hypothetical protein
MDIEQINCESPPLADARSRGAADASGTKRHLPRYPSTSFLGNRRIVSLSVHDRANPRGSNQRG